MPLTKSVCYYQFECDLVIKLIKYEKYTTWSKMSKHFQFQMFCRKSKEMLDELFANLGYAKKKLFGLFFSEDFVIYTIKRSESNEVKENII